MATPGTAISRGRILHRASTDISITERSSEDSPAIMTRLVDDTGCNIAGGLETFGRACAWVICSCTTWRAAKRSVPGSKMSSIEDSPGIDFERNGDQLLHLCCRQPERFGLDLHPRRRKLREDVDRCLADLDSTEEDQAGGQGKNEDLVPQARRDDRTHHRRRPHPAQTIHCDAVPV